MVVPFTTALGGEVELADVPGYGPVLPATARDLLHDALDLTQVAVNDEGVVFAVSDPTPAPAAAVAEPAPAREADEVTDVPAEAAPVRDVLREAIVAMGTAPAPAAHGANQGVAGYRVPARVQRFLSARDRTCVFPGCHRPAAETDADHRIPWPAGATHPDNLQCLCRHHHRAKQTVFTVQLVDGDYRWITRGGWDFWRRHQGY